MKFQEKFKGSIVTLVLISAVVLATYSSFNKEIIINIDGKTSKIDTISTTVAGVLISKNINLKEGSRLEPELDTKVKDNMEIKITNQFKVNIEDSGIQTEYITNQDTVGSILESCNIILGENDIVNKGLDEKVKVNEVIKITRVIEDIVVETVSIPFETELTEEKSLLKGETELHIKGKNGIKEVTYKITYNDNQEVSKEKISEQIIKKPINEVIKEGILEADSI